VTGFFTDCKRFSDFSGKAGGQLKSWWNFCTQIDCLTDRGKIHQGVSTMSSVRLTPEQEAEAKILEERAGKRLPKSSPNWPP
jgi:hypothetical protein